MKIRYNQSQKKGEIRQEETAAMKTLQQGQKYGDVKK